MSKVIKEITRNRKDYYQIVLEEQVYDMENN